MNNKKEKIVTLRTARNLNVKLACDFLRLMNRDECYKIAELIKHLNITIEYLENILEKEK